MAFSAHQGVVLEDQRELALPNLAAAVLEGGHVIPAAAVERRDDRGRAQQCDHLTLGHAGLEFVDLGLLHQIALLDVRLVEDAAATQREAGCECDGPDDDPRTIDGLHAPCASVQRVG